MPPGEDAAMQKFLLASFAVLGFAIPAEAQRQPPSDLWCREERIGPGPFDTVMRCEAYTYQQCMASRTNSGTCFRNPRYAQPRR
jgi:hypothetical protein